MVIRKFLDKEGAQHLAERLQQIVRNTSCTFSSITDKPNTLEGYGIIDGVKVTDLNNYVTQNALVEGFVRKSTLNNYVTKAELNNSLNPEAVSNEEELAAMIATEEPITAIKIEENISLTEDMVIPVDKEIILTLNKNSTLSLGAKTIRVLGKLVIEGDGTITSPGTGYFATIIADGANAEVIVKSGKIINTGANVLECQNGATITVNGGEILGQEFGICPKNAGSTVNINGGIIKTVDNAAIGSSKIVDHPTKGDEGGTIINITGGRLEGHVKTSKYVACGIYMSNHGICNISGGEIVAINGCGICQRAGIVNITGGMISGSGANNLAGKIGTGESRLVVGPNGIVVDQAGHYPGIDVNAEDAGLHLNIYSGIIVGKNTSIQVLKDANYEVDININGGLLMPSYE